MGFGHEQVKSCRVYGDFVDVGYMYMQLHACKLNIPGFIVGCFLEWNHQHLLDILL